MVQTFMIYLISYVKSYVNIAYQDKCLTPSFAKHQPPAIKKANGMSKPKQPTYTSNRKIFYAKKLREKMPHRAAMTIVLGACEVEMHMGLSEENHATCEFAGKCRGTRRG